MTFTVEKKKRSPAIALPHLKRPVGVEPRKFTRAEVAEIFNNAVHPSQVSRFQEVLAGIEPHELIDRDGVWCVYVFLCWRQLKTLRDGTRHTWKKRFQSEFEEMGEVRFLDEYVHGPGGSREDCDRMIDDYLVKKNTKKFA